MAFDTMAPTVAERRAEANAKIIAKFGLSPAMCYVQPGLPFPPFVHMQIWDSETDEWCSS